MKNNNTIWRVGIPAQVWTVLVTKHEETHILTKLFVKNKNERNSRRMENSIMTMNL
jgi:hypothetical protein